MEELTQGFQQLFVSEARNEFRTCSLLKHEFIGGLDELLESVCTPAFRFGKEAADGAGQTLVAHTKIQPGEDAGASADILSKDGPQRPTKTT